MNRTIAIFMIVSIVKLVACQTLHATEEQQRRVKKIPVADFFRNPQKTGYKISPDGKFYAYRDPVNGITNLFIKEIGKKDPVQMTFSTERDINRFYWGNKDHLLYLQDNQGDENYSIYRVNIGSKKVTRLTDFGSKVSASVMDQFKGSPDEIIILMNKRDNELFDPYLLNIVTGRLKMLIKNPGNVRSWMVDNSGKIRITKTSDGLLYRKDESSEFNKVLKLGDDDVFDIQYFTPDDKSVYAYSNVGRDKIAIVEYDLDKKREVRVLLEDPFYDVFGDDEVDHFLYSKSTKKLIYALYTAEKRKIHIFDKEVEEAYQKIKAKIGNYEVLFSSISDNLSNFIIFARSDRLEGSYYSYNAKHDQLEFLSKASPWLNENDMAEMNPIKFQSRDGLTIHGYLTIPLNTKPENLPVIINPHPGPQWRNSWKFDQFTQFFANRGYAVMQINFRGSEGYGKAFLRAGFKQWGLKMQDDISDGVLWLIDQGIADKDRIGIYGLSFGGYAALAGITFTPELFCCGVDLWGISNYFTWYDNFPPRWKQYADEIHRRWGDPVADKEQMRATSPMFHVKNIKAPVFIVQSANDSRVRRQQSEEFIEELKKHNKEYEYILLQGEGHALSNEKKLIEMMGRLEIFLEKYMK